jgi:hypothetical protein
VTRESRDRVEGEKGQQTRRGLRGEVRHPKGSPRGQERSGSSQVVPPHPAISMGRQPGSKGMENRVLELPLAY